MLLHKKIRKYTIVGLMQDEHKKLIPHVAPKLFKRYPSMTHMRDPLNAGWNRKLDVQLSAHELTELIDFSPLNLIFHNFLEVIGLPVSIIDSNARVLASSKWQRICSEFHRVNTRTLARCLECDAVLARVSGENARGSFYTNGYTYSGHPVSCAAALANIDIIEEKGLLAHVREIAPYFQEEIRKLGERVAQDGVALVPLSLYFKDSRVKVELGLCKGKKLYDKRDSDAERNAKRDMDRAMKERNFKE